jgi:predicted nucleotidyltransferase
MSLFEELIEDKELDKKIIKSFKSKPILCPSIFKKNNGDYKIHEDIRKKLLEISNEYLDFIDVEFFVHDVVLTGSLSNYNWSEFSDVDLHIIIDMDEFDNKKNSDSTILHKIIEDFFDSKEKVWKSKHNIKIKGFDLEIYIQDLHQDHVSSGVYSILNNKWVIKPEKTNPNIDDNKIIQKGEEYGKQIDDLIDKLSQNKDISDDTSKLYKKIKNFRQSGLESGGEYSYENLTFKLLRRNGYIEKLLNLKSKIIDKKLSITEQ